MIKKLQAYAYLGGNTKQVKCNIIADDVLYNKIKALYEQDYDPYKELARWDDFDSNNAPETINNWFGAHLLATSTESTAPLDTYIALLSGETPDTSIDSVMYGLMGINPTFYRNETTRSVSKLITLDNVDIVANEGHNLPMGEVDYDELTHTYRLTSYGFGINNSAVINEKTEGGAVRFTVFPEGVFSGNGIDCTSYIENNDVAFPIEILYQCDTANNIVEYFLISINGASTAHFRYLENYFKSVNINTPGSTEDDIENPYGYEGTSGPGGGNGKYGDIDGIDATEVPDLPSINAASLGLITLYNPTAGIVNQLAQFLWSGMFDPDSFKKLFADPMGCLIGLSIVPAIPSSGGSKNIKFGSVDTGINCSYLSSNYVQVDCGSLSVDEYVGSFLDYDPYCKISIFLPYCGFHTLSADDLVGGSIEVVYNVDILSGNCIAFIAHSEKGVLYSYSGTCLTNVPLTGQSFSGALEAYYTGLAGIGGSALGALGTGGAGLVSTAGQAATFAMNTMFNSKPDFQRSGGSGGAAGIMGVQKPFLVIERPRFSVPNQVQRYVGQTSNITMNLGNCSGFTMVEYVHIHGVNATSEEIKEIESLLKEGVIL